MPSKSTAQLVNEYDLMSLEKVKQYIGIFTGKTVKSSSGWEYRLKEFHKGERVVVFHLEEFGKFLNDASRIMSGEFDKI
jgi:predicted SpoU family rRNA methylase